MTLIEVAQDLSNFDAADGQHVEAWTEEEKEAAQLELGAFGETAIFSLPAYISFGASCGFAGSGRLAYVANRLNNRPVRATVRVRWTQGINSGQYDTVKTIPAGSRVRLGCTRGGGTSYATYNYSVVGAQAL